ncbi:PQ-loop domain-containing transporter [Bradyrhizobium sp. S3.9.2]|uniref:PQ-loop domain-containing transporter n=1 Tax=Bradyrhizobium sp. S3.9.2 TaxID=3156432 RepID=UPI003396F940
MNGNRQTAPACLTRATTGFLLERSPHRIGAYVPQIWHLWSEQCSAGISECAYALWVLSSALFSVVRSP